MYAHVCICAYEWHDPGPLPLISYLLCEMASNQCFGYVNLHVKWHQTNASLRWSKVQDCIGWLHLTCDPPCTMAVGKCIWYTIWAVRWLQTITDDMWPNKWDGIGPILLICDSMSEMVSNKSDMWFITWHGIGALPCDLTCEKVSDQCFWYVIQQVRLQWDIFVFLFYCSCYHYTMLMWHAMTMPLVEHLTINSLRLTQWAMYYISIKLQDNCCFFMVYLCYSASGRMMSWGRGIFALNSNLISSRRTIKKRWPTKRKRLPGLLPYILLLFITSTMTILSLMLYILLLLLLVWILLLLNYPL